MTTANVLGYGFVSQFGHGMFRGSGNQQYVARKLIDVELVTVPSTVSVVTR